MKNRFLLPILALAAFGWFAGIPAARADQNGTLAINSWNNKFYNGTNGFFDTNNAGTQSSFWVNAEMIELEEDAGYINNANAELTHFTNTYGTNWSGNNFNDDITWAAIAYRRAGQTAVADSNFNMMWNRGYDTNLIQGIWWSTSKGSKQACVNGPACIYAAMMGDSTRANLIWNGFLSNPRVCDTSKYRIADHINLDGSVEWVELSYNMGVEIGAAAWTGHSTPASMAVNESKSAFGIPIRSEGTGNGDGDGYGFRGIFARYANLGGGGSYLSANATDAWNNRNSSGLMAGTWTSRTADTAQYAWETSAGAAMVVNAPGPGMLANGVHTLTPQCATGSRLDDNNAGTANGNKVQIWSHNGTQAQNWSFANVGGSNWNMAVNLGPYCLDARAGTVGAAVTLWTCGGTAAQKWTAVQTGNNYNFKNGINGNCLDVAGALSANGTAVQNYTCNNSSAQAWAISGMGQ